MKNKIKENTNLFINMACLLLAYTGYTLNNGIILSAGLYALSGAITNWLAIYMLFEKVPFLYGSGVITLKFTEFKQSIKILILQEFFNKQNIEQYLNKTKNNENIDLEPIVSKLDYKRLFNSLVDTVMSSSLGSMVNMIGGAGVFNGIQEKFRVNTQAQLLIMVNDSNLKQMFLAQIDTISPTKIHNNLEKIIDNRLDELTPTLVKNMIQNIIRKHLSWLVVWGGVFGAIIGIAAGCMQIL